jgi:hypothetical protein
MDKRTFLKGAALGLSAAPVAAAAAPAKAEADDRAYMAGLLQRIADPVLDAIARGELRKRFDLELSPTWDGRPPEVAYLECFARLISGLAPWLALPQDSTPEGRVRKRLTDQTLEGIARSVDPASPDYMGWRSNYQAMVDSAYFTQALLRAPKTLWEPLDTATKRRIVEEIKGLRRVITPRTNWLLFAAMNEAFLLSIGEDYDPFRMTQSIRTVADWYVGDGWVKDGPVFHFDYYNAFVILPMMVQILETMEANKAPFWKDDPKVWRAQWLKRMQRHSEHLERFVSPQGTFPPFGRSLTYRTAVFQPLAWLAWRKALPEKVSEAQVRGAVTAANKAIFRDPGNFTKAGYLTLGFVGHHPALADPYSNSGSMYITTESFLALGLPSDDSYWTSGPQPWTQKKAFAGQAFPKDYAVDY